jgi:putative Holliday junction resolvase
MRLLGIDFGVRRIGLALSDLLGITAQPLCTVERTNLKADIERIDGIAREQTVTKIVIGLPLNMDGTEGSLTGDVRSFAEKLGEKTGLPVEFYDERLTTMQAERFLVEEADISRAKRKGARDRIAASFILQSYMEHQRSG